jgi:hypothetical protein
MTPKLPKKGFFHKEDCLLIFLHFYTPLSKPFLLITPHVLCGNLYGKILFAEFGGHLESCFFFGQRGRAPKSPLPLVTTEATRFWSLNSQVCSGARLFNGALFLPLYSKTDYVWSKTDATLQLGVNPMVRETMLLLINSN